MKNRLPIIVAIVLGVVAVLAIKSYVNRKEAETAALLAGSPVLVAAIDISTGTELTEGMLTTTDVPDQFIPRQAVTSSDEMRQIIGRRTRVPLAAQQMILWADLEIEKRGGLSSLIPEGERAFTVDLTSGVNVELLQLNDRVDIIGIFQQPADTGSAAARAAVVAGAAENAACVVLLQNVNIMAIGSTIGQVYGAEQQGGVGNVTFSVTLPEAQLLNFAAQHGELALVLRRDGEIEVLARKDLPRITMRQFEELISDMDEKRKTRVVQVMKGQEIEEIKIGAESGVQTFE